MAVLIGKKIKSRVPTENLHMLGLFHDAGIPALAVQYPDYINVLEQANSDHSCSLVAYEETAYRTNHAVIGYYFCQCLELTKKTPVSLFYATMITTFSIAAKMKAPRMTMATLKMAENFVHLQRRFSLSQDWQYFEASALAVLDLENDDYLDIKDDVEEYLLYRQATVTFKYLIKPVFVAWLYAIKALHLAALVTLSALFCSTLLSVFSTLGVGGLAIAQQVRQLLPQYDIHYVADRLYALWRQKPRASDIKVLAYYFSYLCEHGASAIVLACNTATMAAIDTLRAQFTAAYWVLSPA